MIRDKSDGDVNKSDDGGGGGDGDVSLIRICVWRKYRKMDVFKA